MDIQKFSGIKPFEKKIWLSSPTMHSEELKFVAEAVETNWVSTVGENINALEKQVAEYVGTGHAVGLSSGTAALHMCMKLAGERINPGARPGQALEGQKVFCSDMTFGASVNPIVYEGGEPIFIDAEADTWNMSPEALERAFEKYSGVRLVVLAHLYGVPAKMDEILSVCRKYGALLVEDAAEALGAEYHGRADGKCGALGDFCVISGNGNKLVTGSGGGLFLTKEKKDADRVRKWSMQSREDAAWYQHEELGYNYRMSNIIAGVFRGNLLHVEEHLQQKKRIYERYREAFEDLPIHMNPFEESRGRPNYWLSCLLIDKEAMCEQVRGERKALYQSEMGKSCPTEILEALGYFHAEGRPLWKPMHLQPLYRSKEFVKADYDGCAERTDTVGGMGGISPDLFARGLCLPSDNKMTVEEQERVIAIVRRCFGEIET